MTLLDFETALGRLVRVPDGDPFRSLDLSAEERARLEALAASAGFRFTVGVQRSWCIRRAGNAGYLTLSILPEDLRRRLLDEWISQGGGTSSFFAAEAEALFEFVAQRLPHPSHELAACRFEQASLRANEGTAQFLVPAWTDLDFARSSVQRGRHAGVVLFHGEPDVILAALLERKPLPPVSSQPMPILFGPGLDRLCRPAAASEAELWERLTAPVAFSTLLWEGYRRDVIETMLQGGAIEIHHPLPSALGNSA